MIDYSTEDNNEKSGYYDRRRNINDKKPMVAAILPLFNFSSVVICRSLAHLLDPANNLASSCTLHAPCCTYPTDSTEEGRGEEWWNGGTEQERKYQTVESDIKCLPVRTTEKKYIHQRLLRLQLLI
jgi:hypothetical protein